MSDPGGLRVYRRRGGATFDLLRLLRPLGAVFRATLPAILDALGVVSAADDVIADAGEILDAAAADQDDRVLLQIVALARDVARDLKAVGQADARDLAQGRVRLLRRRRVDARADPAFLRALRHRRHLVSRDHRLARLVDQLIYRRHPPNLNENDNRPTLTRVERLYLSAHLNTRPLAKAPCHFVYRAAFRWPPTASPHGGAEYRDGAQDGQAECLGLPSGFGMSAGLRRALPRSAQRR